jgi:hypothetical protein
LTNAMDNGTILRGTAQRLTSKVRASRNVTIRMAEADLDLARKSRPKKRDCRTRPTSSPCCMKRW